MDRDKFEAFLAAINGNKYDIEAWHGMLRVIYNEKVEHYRDSVYERLVNVFPTSGKFWRIYIEHEVNIEVTILKWKKFMIVFEITDSRSEFRTCGKIVSKSSLKSFEY